MEELREVGPDSLERFLVGWHGEPDLKPVSLEEEDVPPPLRQWFELTSRWSKPLTSQNRVLRPERTWVEDGKRVFWVENQGVWLWAMDLSGEDPAVFDRLNDSGEPWERTGVSLSTFMLHVAVFEAIMSAPHAAATSGVTRSVLEAILAPLKSLPMPDWRWPAPGHRLYSGDGLLAFAGPNPAGGEEPPAAVHCEAWIVAKDSDRLGYLTAIDGADWDLIPG